MVRINSPPSGRVLQLKIGDGLEPGAVATGSSGIPKKKPSRYRSRVYSGVGRVVTKIDPSIALASEGPLTDSVRLFLVLQYSLATTSAIGGKTG